jgi:hypothetical protein
MTVRDQVHANIGFDKEEYLEAVTQMFTALARNAEGENLRPLATISVILFSDANGNPQLQLCTVSKMNIEQGEIVGWLRESADYIEEQPHMDPVVEGKVN